MLIERSEPPSLARANIADADAAMLMSVYGNPYSTTSYNVGRTTNWFRNTRHACHIIMSDDWVDGASDLTLQLSSFNYFTHRLVEQELTRLERSKGDPLKPPESEEVKARDTETKRETTAATTPSID